MLTSEAFIDYVLNGQGVPAHHHDAQAAESDIDGFGDDDQPAPDTTTSPADSHSFAQNLLEAASFGIPELVERNAVIRSADAVAMHLANRVAYWPMTATRKYQTLLFEIPKEKTSSDLLGIPAFKTGRLAHLEDVEGALARMVAEALEGFQRGGEGVTADVRKGLKSETLCVISIVDTRGGGRHRLVCFGTVNAKTDGLETFVITEETRSWDPQLAREHLGLLYESRFKKLGTIEWQEAFTKTEEREKARELLKVCTQPNPAQADIQTGILDLLDTIAKGFGLRKKPNVTRRLQAFGLPADHDIGLDPDAKEKDATLQNPFSGVTLRDDRERLLGYIIYPLASKGEADKLREHLKKFNRFHNVLVVYPDSEQATLELWQGSTQLTGKLRKGQAFSSKDAADVVNLLSRFFVVSKAKVKNPSELAQELAYRARYLRRLALRQLGEEHAGGPLQTLYSEFKKALVHDQKPEEFADAFAQTLTYSLLTARWVLVAQAKDPALAGAAPADRFSRKAAMKRLSIGSRFLAEMFDAVLKMKLEDSGRMLWLVDDIADLLDRVDVVEVFKDDGSDVTADPVIHFYEPFLAQYDAKIRMQRGAFYTPKPVVSYIVRSVHELLQTEFGLVNGLADTATWGEMLARQPGLKLPMLTDDPKEERTIAESEPFVQILDPATGTGTFLVEVIDVIYKTLRAKWLARGDSEAEQRAEWNRYVPKHLLPRLYAYELMMAPYAIAHMKVGLKLAETGYAFGTEERANIFLTNALEPWVRTLALVGFPALAHEAEAVNDVKRFKRFTVVVGNPPYSGEGMNKGEWIRDLVDTYMYVDGAHLGEKGKKNWLQDDYVKFLRLSQYLIDQSRTGVVGLITNHAFVDNPTFRGMRASLAGSFSRIRVLDLHGNTKRKEVSPDGTPDENVFDIVQGVAITLLSQSPSTSSRSGISCAHLWGPQDASANGKYQRLSRSSVTLTDWLDIQLAAPHYLYIIQDAFLRAEFEDYWKLTDIMPHYGAGVITSRDDFVVDFEDGPLLERLVEFGDSSVSDASIREKFGIRDNSMWSMSGARKAFSKSPIDDALFVDYLYRPFDRRRIYFETNVVFNMRTQIMSHLLDGGTPALVTSRQATRRGVLPVFATVSAIDAHAITDATSITTIFPLFLQENARATLLSPDSTLRPNISPAFNRAFNERLNVEQTDGGRGLGRISELTPTQILHYTYSVLHSSSYVTRYADFLKIDFPRIPLTSSLALVRALANLGSELFALHLLEHPKQLAATASFDPGSRTWQLAATDGHCLARQVQFHGPAFPPVAAIGYSSSTIWLDFDKKSQRGKIGFSGVPDAVWNFHVGGYQVCDKWLKERKSRTLNAADIAHYLRIIIAITETIRLMAEIDEVIDAHGGWPDAFAPATPAQPGQ